MTVSSYLLIIDTSPISEGLKDYFAKFNINIIQRNSLDALDITNDLPLAILIDWCLLENAQQTIKDFYTNYPVPLLIMNDYPNENICINALEHGADDFMVKPLYPRELHARVTAIKRRVSIEQEKMNVTKEVYHFANWRLFPASRQVFDEEDQELNLSAGEYDLLYIFVQQPNKILDREFLLQVTKNTDLNPYDRRIDVQISRLRHKIEFNWKKPGIIKTIRNGGYMFTTDVVKESIVV